MRGQAKALHCISIHRGNNSEARQDTISWSDWVREREGKEERKSERETFGIGLAWPDLLLSYSYLSPLPPPRLVIDHTNPFFNDNNNNNKTTFHNITNTHITSITSSHSTGHITDRIKYAWLPVDVRGRDLRPPTRCMRNDRPLKHTARTAFSWHPELLFVHFGSVQFTLSSFAS